MKYLLTAPTHSFYIFLLIAFFSGCLSGTPIKNAHAYTIEIKQMKFVPAELVLHKGDTVRFINHDLVPHDITEATRKAWTSAALPVDASWSLVVTESADYYCTIHPVMKGKLIVE
jgi:plastocyanin